MDQNELRKLEDKCTQENPPTCTAGCPIHVDARKFVTDIQKEDLKSALATLHKKQPFPGIIGRICDHPCEDVCKRRDVGSPIAISALERFVVQTQPPAKVKSLKIPPKSQKVAIVGSGLRGLTASLDLAKKGYMVSLFDKADRLGGNLWDYPEHQLPPEVITEELSALSRFNVQIELNKKITGQDLENLKEDYNAVYLALPEQSQAALEILGDQSAVNPVTAETKIPGIFSGAFAGTDSPIRSVADGRKGAVSIDRYLLGVSMQSSREGEGSMETGLFVSTEGISPLPVVPMSDPLKGYNSEEALLEAARCLNCQCLECVKACKFLQYYNSYPKEVIRQIYNNDTIVMGIRHANKMINSCSLCGQCAVICPNDLDVGEACKEIRESMVSKEKMPPSAHDFALRDMAFNNSEQFALTRHQPGHTSSKYVFFPGCQLSGSSPEHVENIYNYLTDKLSGGVGLMLRCCGAPADWAGEKNMYQDNLKILTEQWEELGKPKIIVACSTCHSMFRDKFPELISLWQVMDESGLPLPETVANKGTLAVQDACTTRHEADIQNSVRSILTKMGYEVEELPFTKERTKCCGFGGLTSFVNQDLAKQIVEDRIGESSKDYVAYCAMCRDRFASKGKHTVHLLDLIFGSNYDEAASRPGVGFSYKHENRAKLKRKLLHAMWKEPLEEREEACLDIKLQLSDRILDIMEERHILVEDIQRVIEAAERTGKKFINPNNGHSLAYIRPVKVTYWVEYQPLEQGFEVINVYSHRMEIL